MAGGGADEIVVGDFLGPVAAGEDAVLDGPDRARKDVPAGGGFAVEQGFCGGREGGGRVCAQGRQDEQR